MPGFINFFISRCLQIVVTLFIISVVVFLILRISGDPVQVTTTDFMSKEQIEQIRKFWGFDRPIDEQYIIFISKAVTGDFGTSYLAKRPAMELVIERLGNTLLLAAASAAIGVTIAIPLGILSALKRNSPLDFISTALASLGTAMPSFWFGLMLIIIFSVYLRILPAFGALEPTAIIMPSVTLGVGMAARLSRMTRSAMLEVLNQDYVRTARSKGLKQNTVVIRHTLRNALIPIVTVFGLQLGWLLGGSIIVESVFSWPGLGRLIIDSINVRDNTVVQAALLWLSLSVMLINFLIDVFYILIDPRVQFS